jgi:hypothetical protein
VKGQGRWMVQRLDLRKRSPWIAYRAHDLAHAQTFRTQRWAMRYALAGGAL